MRKVGGCSQLTALHAGQAKVSSHQILFTTAELLDLPDHCRLFRGVADRADSRLHARFEKRERLSIIKIHLVAVMIK